MRFSALLLSLLALTTGVSADGMGQYRNSKAAKDARIDRDNTIVVQSNSGVSIVSRSLNYNPATVNTTAQLAYDEVDINVGATRSGNGGYGKLEIFLQSFNYTQAGSGRRADIAIEEFAFAWRPYSIVQYVENSKDGNGIPIQNGFDVNDTLCHEYQIRPGKSAFTFKFLQSKTVDAENGTAVLNTYEGSSADGVIKLILKATGSETDDPKKIGTKRGKSIWVDGRFVSPTSIKFDIGIDVTKPKFGLNTTGVCGGAYQIAIRSWARSLQEVYGRTTTQTTVNGTVTNNRQVTTLLRIQAGGNASPFGFFTWATTAKANTTSADNVTTTSTTNVIATTLKKIANMEDNDALRSHTKEAIHSFDAIRPTQLLWDPELGSDTTDPDVTAAATDSSTADGTPIDNTSTGTNTDPTTTDTPTDSPTSTPTNPSTGTGFNAASTTDVSIITLAIATVVTLFAQ